MSAITRTGIGVAALAVLVVPGELMPAPAAAGKELHNVTYLARVDGVAPGGQATFKINDTEVNTAPLNALPGHTFEAHTVLAEPSEAGMRVAIPWPYSANVHCQIDVDDAVVAEVDQFVAPKPGNGDPASGVVACGAPLNGAG